MEDRQIAKTLKNLRKIKVFGGPAPQERLIMTPGWHQVGSKMSPRRPIMGQDTPKMDPSWGNVGEDAAKMAQDSPKMDQDRPKTRKP